MRPILKSEHATLDVQIITHRLDPETRIILPSLLGRRDMLFLRKLMCPPCSGLKLMRSSVLESKL